MTPTKAGPWLLILASSLGASSAVAQDRAAAAEGGPWPLTVRIELPPASLARTYANWTPGGISGPPTPAGKLKVGELVLRTWAALAQRAFSGRAPEPDVRLEVEIAVADADLDRDGWAAVLEERVSLRDRAGKELASWRIRRASPIVGTGETAVERAFARAATDAWGVVARELPARPELAVLLERRPAGEPADAPGAPPAPSGTAAVPPAQDRADAAASAYPLTLRIDMPAASRATRYLNATPGGISGPPTPAGKVAVGALVLRAWTEMARRDFAGRDATPDLRLEVEIVAADVELTRLGWIAILAQRASLRDPAGAELARWTWRHERPILGRGEHEVPRAFSRAAADAVDELERGFAAAPGIAAFLAARDVAPREPFRAPPPPAAPAGPALDPPRADPAAFVDIGGMVVPSAPGGAGFGFAARAGLSLSSLRVTAGLDAWGVPLEAPPGGPPTAQASGAELKLLGVDVALVGRPARRHELAAGAGLGWLAADGTLYYSSTSQRLASASGLQPSVFASYVYALPAGPREGVRLGVEVRRPLGTAPMFEALHLRVPADELSVRLLLGLEFAAGR
ncbi:MAG TPA: hypothetical protein VF841_12535 [Anaeromyxobacter sp.]